MRKALLALALAAGCGGAAPRQETPAPADDPLAPLAWLAGDWVGQGPDGAAAEEHWAASDGRAMAGRALAEDLRIEAREGAIEYVARPDGAAGETRFRATEIAGSRVVFENPEHDFPQRIEYVREGDRLTAAISDRAGDRRLVWTFERR